MRLSVSILMAFIAMQLLAGCSTPVRPAVTFGADVTLSEEPTIFVSTPIQLNRIEQSLRRAGLKPVSSLSEAQYHLEVQLGRGRGNFGECGVSINVIYTLSRNSDRLLVMKGRGMMGLCDSSIYNQLSQKLATFFQ
jgi:hypothetical protein